MHKAKGPDAGYTEMDEDAASTPYEPNAYCAKCDVQTDAGICPECGSAIVSGEPGKKPRNRARKQVWTLAATALVAMLITAAWLAWTRHELVPYLPTLYLLNLRASGGPLTVVAGHELAKRLREETLTEAQREKFAKQWADATWFAELDRFTALDLRDRLELLRAPTTAFVEAMRGREPGERLPFLLLGNAFTRRHFPYSGRLSIIYEEEVRALRVDGVDVPIEGTMSIGFQISLHPEMHVCRPIPSGLCDAFGGSGPAPLGERHGFSTSCMMVTPGLEPGVHDLEIETTVFVWETDRSSIVASWPSTHHLRVEIAEGFTYYTPQLRHYVDG